MKILDILYEEHYNTTRKEIKTNKLKRPKNIKIQKDGFFSNVNNDKSDPFTVNKHSKFHPELKNDATVDGYWAYIENIIDDDDLKSNPFLPRLYSVTTVKDKFGNNKKHANIEKLIHYYDIDEDLLENYISTIIKTDRWVKRSSQSYISYISSILNDSAVTNNFSFIKNEKLIQALEYIHNMGKLYDIDIHEDNIMFRRTPYGIQLVITDPLSFKHN